MVNRNKKRKSRHSILFDNKRVVEKRIKEIEDELHQFYFDRKDLQRMQNGVSINKFSANRIKD